jgi:DnaJ like chaperone protein
MSKFGKWIGGGLGWALFGPMGGLAGFVLGSLFDNAEVNVIQGTQPGNNPGYNPVTASGDFAMSLLVLSAAVMKGDGKVLKSELDYVKNFLTVQFGDQNALRLLPALKKLLEQSIPVKDVCSQIRQFMPESQRLQLLHYLFGIAKADGLVHTSELKLIEEIAHLIGISSADTASLKAMYFRDENADYRILEIEASATYEEVKKAYRKMALKFHPDRVADLGDEAQKAAKERFQHVQEAYENICKIRGFS